jgi:hypothetical protein
MFKIGQEVYRRQDAKITVHVITAVKKDVVWVDNLHQMEAALYSAFLFPATPESKALLQRGIDMDLQHTAERDAYSAAMYQLLNAQTLRGER